MGKRLLLIFCAFALVLATCALSQNEDRWKNYQPRTLASIVKAHQEQMDELDSSFFISGDSFPSKVNLTYLETSRPLPAQKDKLLKLWKKSFKSMPADTVEMFQTEVLFKEGTTYIWIAVQKPLLPPLAKEAKVGQMITGYVAWVGAVKVSDHFEFLFILNEFDAN